MQSNTPPAKTLLSILEPFQKQDNFPKDVVHPFSTGAPETCSLLHDLLNATNQISTSLRVYEASAQWTNAKLVSLLRQHTSIEHTSYSADKGVQHLIQSLRARPGVSYGENIPLLATSLPDWCIEQLISLGKSLGMEAFQDGSREGASTVVLGGKLLVIDIDFAIQRNDLLKPKVIVTSVKTSYALLPGNSNSNVPSLLDSFLAGEIQYYCEEVQKDEEFRDPHRAALFRKQISEHLQYLVLLDGLASRNNDGGIRWFTDIDELSPILDELVKTEAQAIATSLSSQKAPLDVFLLRSHSLPLPYLTGPSISFLIHLSPSAYLSLIRNSVEQSAIGTYPFLDISPVRLKKGLNNITKGVTLATLRLEQLPGAHLYPGSISMPDVTSRPTFPLCPSASRLDHLFPHVDNFGVALNPPGTTSSEPPYAWLLDFTESGKRSGIVMSQSRMKEIELVINPLSVGNALGDVADMLSPGSWIDLLLNPDKSVSAERYTALYTSPSSLHPPLQLRLAAPEEPGYILDRIPIRSMKEVWGILEIVREQCWLNETLLACQWTAEMEKSEDDAPDNPHVTEDDLQAVLTGTFIPRKIPVNVFLPSGSEADNLFGPPDLGFSPESRPKILMTCPERAPISGLIEIKVTYDEKKPQGVSVSIQGAVGLDINTSHLEEVCRRGGTWGLPGRIWLSGHA